MFAQLRPGRFHIANHDGEVLEPEIVAVRRHGNRPHIGRRQKLNQLQLLLAELQPNDPRPHPENSPELIVLRPIHFHIADLLERQHIG